jgi:hypothetical protein
MVIPQTLNIDLGFVNHQTLGDSVNELIPVSHRIYQHLLMKPYPTSLICGGQSPAYYCLAMMHLPIYKPEKVEIIILPHSKCSRKTTDPAEIYREKFLYSQRLRENNIKVYPHVTILDGVHSGTGILALQDILQFHFNDLKVEKIAINSCQGIAKIYVDWEIIAPSQPKFSDVFPRLINSYYPREFHDPSKFKNHFQLEDNPLAIMVTKIAKVYYGKGDVEKTTWFQLNNIVTDAIQEKREAREGFLKANALRLEKEREREKNNGGVQALYQRISLILIV